MKKITKKVKNYTDNINIIENDLNKKILHVLIFSFIFLVFSYAFILGNIVFSVVERKNLEAEAKNLSNEVAELELKYLSISSQVDPILSREMGFKETQTHFAVRKSLSALVLNTNEL